MLCVNNDPMFELDLCEMPCMHATPKRKHLRRPTGGMNLES